MSARAMMTMRAIVERLEPGSTNPDGHRSFDGWFTHVAALPCYVWDRKRQEVMGTQTTVVAEVKAMVPMDTDITELDRLNGITLRNGDSYSSGIFRILAVSRRATHLELLMAQVTGGRSAQPGGSS